MVFIINKIYMNCSWTESEEISCVLEGKTKNLSALEAEYKRLCEKHLKKHNVNYSLNFVDWLINVKKYKKVKFQVANVRF